MRQEKALNPAQGTVVPAGAEVVIEGHILPDERAEEGPFAEWPGHYVGGGLKPVIEVDAITMRRDAIFQDIKEQEKKSGLTFVSYPPRRTEPNQAPQPTGTAIPVPPGPKSLEAAPVTEL